MARYLVYMKQKYLILSGKSLKEDNGSGYTLHRHLDRKIVSSANYLIGYYGVCLDGSTINYCEALSKVSKKWMEKVCPDLVCYK